MTALEQPVTFGRKLFPPKSRPDRWCRIALRALELARARALIDGDPDRAQRLTILIGSARVEAELYPDRTLRPPPASGRTIGWHMRNDPHTRAVRALLGLSVPDPESDDE